MLRIVCVQTGDYEGRGPEYVNRLYDAVRRNLKDGTEGEFICFSDSVSAAGYDRGVKLQRVTPGLDGWWNKLLLFAPGVFEAGDRIMYFDLDTVITGRLDEIVDYDGEFAILRDWFNPEGVNSSVMSWRAGFGAEIWASFSEAGCPQIAGGDQEWIRQHVATPDIWQDLFPGLFVSYKQSGGKIPTKASVCCFHGHPRPHEVLSGWVPEVWKIGGLVRAELDSICNTEAESLLANVRRSIEASYPWLDRMPAHDGHAVIVGGGPSLQETIVSLRQRKKLGQSIWALNGSADWLKNNDIIPDFHVLVDARADNTRFVRTASDDTEYLIASQCDASMFEALEGRKVTLWHSGADGVADLLKDEVLRPVHLIGGGSTVGLSAIVLAFAMGYRAIHLYGFDSSYREDTHHAYMQNLNDGDMVVDVLAGDRRFRASPWMVQQAEEFCRLSVQLADDGCVITVAGDGLLPSLAHDLMSRPLSAPEIRANEIFARLPAGKVRGAEIGVFTGALSRLLLSRPNLHLTMVDSWAGNGRDYVGATDDWHAGLSQQQQDLSRRAAESAVGEFQDRSIILPVSSQEAARAVADRSLDFVFIDADHSYEGCARDLKLWAPKVRCGGLLSGHDYANTAFEAFGVTRAVDEFVAAHGLRLELGDNFTWFTQLP